MDRQHHRSKCATLSEFPKARPEGGGFSELPSEASRRSGLARRAERCRISIASVFLMAGSRLEAGQA